MLSSVLRACSSHEHIQHSLSSEEGVQVKVAANQHFCLLFFLGFWTDLLTAVLDEVSVGSFPFRVSFISFFLVLKCLHYTLIIGY